ncbi:MAG: glycosyltransferase family 39 protein [Saprospiraceae bacterium]|nr:glycosyltransferase family 39 protein [Saprospiraceae bacterium]
MTLLLGILLRGNVWLQQRSIFLDEANLIQNYLEKSYAELFGHLDYQQYAPPLFSVIMKFVFQTFGVNELSAKAFPLLCGIGLLFAFYSLAQRLLSRFAAAFALLFVCFDKIFIDYATECKQYATDALITVTLLLLSQTIDFKSFNRQKAILWALIGSLAIGFSMPSIFVLASVGAYYIYQFWHTKNKAALWQIGSVGGFWLVQFAVYFLFVLKTDAQSDNLQNYHLQYFFAFPPLSMSDLSLLKTQVLGIIDRAIGITVLAAVLAILSFLIGVIHLWRTQKGRFLLLLLPIVLTLTASALHYYSLIARLILFLLPIFILLIFIGFDTILKKAPLPFSVIITIGFVATIIVQIQVLKPFEYFRNDYSELRDGLDFIKKEKRSDEVFFTSFGVTPVVRFYTQFHDHPYELDKLVLQDYVCCDPHLMENALIALHQKGERRIWLLGDQPTYESFTKFIESQHGMVVKKLEFYRGVALLYEIPLSNAKY